ncbi:MAG: cation-translocating P-type ATPase [Deltaproteobacteria bacterium]
MKIHELGAAAALSSLGSSAAGLSRAEAQRRLAEFGPNQVERVRGKPVLVRFAAQFTHFFAVVLWLAAGMALFAEWRDPGGGMGRLAVAILGVILVNGIFSFAQESRAEHAIAALQKLLPNRVHALRGGEVVEVPAPELVPGDVVLLESGDLVPADCRLIEAIAARVNTSAMTGEPSPEPRDAEPDREPLVRARNVLLAGTFLVSGHARAVIFATGMSTEIGRIARMAQSRGPGLSPLQREIVRMGRIVAVFATALGGLSFFLGQAIGLPLWTNVLFAVGIIVANVPEGLLPTVTLALAMGSQRMAKRRALIRRLPAVETLGCATVICTDKTGTLTQNRMTPVRLYVGSSFQQVEAGSLRRLGSESPELFRCAQLCHDLIESHRGGRSELQGDPMELALVGMGVGAIGPVPLARRSGEIPFDPTKKRLTTLHEIDGATVAYTKGAPETVLPLCTLDAKARDEALRAGEAMAADGLRVLAFARRDVGRGDAPDRDLTFAGLVGLLDPPRPEVPDAIRRCREAGIRVVMVTGDHPRTAAALARGIGLGCSALLTGADVGRMSDEQLQIALDAPDLHFARLDPADKRRVIEGFRRKREIVAATGDGVNDAPALRAADIGIAMGISGTDVAREAADVVLVDDNFASIVNAVEEGRAVFANIRKFLTYILTSNVPELIPWLAMIFFRLPLAMTIMQILAVDLGTDMLPALALGAERSDPGTMQKPPRRREERLLDGSLLLRSYGFLGLLEAAGSMGVFFAVLASGGWTRGAILAPGDPLYLRATAACLATVVVMQVANVFVCRDEREPVTARGPFENPLLLAGIAVELALLAVVVYTAPGQAIFGTAPLLARDWLLTVPCALALLALEELRKKLVRARIGATAAVPHRGLPGPIT